MCLSDIGQEILDTPRAYEHCPTSSTCIEQQARRLQQLENEFRTFKIEIQRALSGKGAELVGDFKPVPHDTSAKDPLHIRNALESDQTSESNDKDNEELRSQEVQYELRRLVPHLSAGFSSTFQDAVFLITAVRNGYGEKGHGSLMDRITVLETEKRQLAQRLARKSEECEDLKTQVCAVRQNIQALRQEEQQKNRILSQKKEEMRKQILIEESKVEKLNARNRKLVLENEELKSRLRASFR